MNQIRVLKIPPEREKMPTTRVTRMMSMKNMRMALMRKTTSKPLQIRMRGLKPIIMRKRTILRDALMRQTF